MGEERYSDFTFFSLQKKIKFVSSDFPPPASAMLTPSTVVSNEQQYPMLKFKEALTKVNTTDEIVQFLLTVNSKHWAFLIRPHEAASFLKS